MSVASSAPTARTRWAVVLTVLLGGMIAALHAGKVPPALPLIRVDLGLGMVDAGFVVSTFNVLGMSLGLLTGVVADHMGRRRLVLLGLLSLTGGGVLGAAGGGFAVLLVSRVLEGLGFMAVSVASPPLVLAAAAHDDRARALALWSMFMPAGMALAMMSAPFALAFLGWRGLWLAIAVLALLGAMAVGYATRDLHTAHGPPAGSRWRVLGETLGRRKLLLLGVVFGGYAFQWIAVMVWLPSFLPAAMGVSATTAALLTALVVAANVPGNYLGGHMLHRGWTIAGIGPLVAAIMALCAVGLFTDVLPDVVRFALVLVFSLAGGTIPAALFATAPTLAASPGHMAASNGMLMQGSNLGQFMGPPLVAAAVTAASGAWSGALVPVLGAAGVTALAAALVGVRPAERASAVAEGAPAQRGSGSGSNG
ncbi:MFS transporter [Roseospira marina]|uniref:MFS transporter n=1 Tax=Roseospira marina TaxID=140057 RepID=A0A5M6IHF8_9PROT|nr:MFS transporter [Roseospira marina]KAA5606998.1 MFS transporter [Roseospira marina]MBB4312820.1 MFS family permease [Roseospira marina]MBB5086407.1 MFS family permease [Roseospira marina]